MHMLTLNHINVQKIRLIISNMNLHDTFFVPSYIIYFYICLKSIKLSSNYFIRKFKRSLTLFSHIYLLLNRTNTTYGLPLSITAYGLPLSTTTYGLPLSTTAYGLSLSTTTLSLCTDAPTPHHHNMSSILCSVTGGIGRGEKGDAHGRELNHY